MWWLCVAFWRSDIQRSGKLSTLAGRLLRAVSRHPFLVCCTIGFLAGCTLDIDHIPSWIFHVSYWVPITIGTPQSHYLGQGRNLHGLALVGGGLMCACAGGLLFLMVLEDQVPRIMARLSRSIKELFQAEKEAN